MSGQQTDTGGLVRAFAAGAVRGIVAGVGAGIILRAAGVEAVPLRLDALRAVVTDGLEQLRGALDGR